MEIQKPARFAAHGQIDGGNNHGGDRTNNTWGPTDREDASAVGAQDGAEHPQSQVDTEDLEGQGRAVG